MPQSFLPNPLHLKDSRDSMSDANSSLLIKTFWICDKISRRLTIFVLIQVGELEPKILLVLADVIDELAQTDIACELIFFYSYRKKILVIDSYLICQNRISE